MSKESPNGPDRQHGFKEPSIKPVRIKPGTGNVYRNTQGTKCTVCMGGKDLIELVDALLLSPKKYRDVTIIANEFLESQNYQGNMLSIDIIQRHCSKHLPLEKRMIREIAERRAIEANVDADDSTTSLITPSAFCELVLQRGWDAIVSGDITPSIRDTLRAMEQLSILDKENQGVVTIDSLWAQLAAIIEAVKRNVSSSIWKKIVADVNAAGVNNMIEVPATESEEVTSC